MTEWLIFPWANSLHFLPPDIKFATILQMPFIIKTQVQLQQFKQQARQSGPPQLLFKDEDWLNQSQAILPHKNLLNCLVSYLNANFGSFSPVLKELAEPSNCRIWLPCCSDLSKASLLITASLQLPHHNKFTAAFINSDCLSSQTEQLRVTVHKLMHSMHAQKALSLCSWSSGNTHSNPDKWTWFKLCCSWECPPN